MARERAAAAGAGGPPGVRSVAQQRAAREFLRTLDRAELSRYSVVGTYLRFDDSTRHTLKEFRQRAIAAVGAHSRHPSNFLLWGEPGSGKSYLVQQIAATLEKVAEYREVNLASSDERTLASSLESLTAIHRPVIFFVDEVDARPDQVWPYETLIPYLDPPTPRPFPTCFCLAGSGGQNLSEFKERMRARPKGQDLLSRIPNGHEFSVGRLGVGDKVLVSAIQLLQASAEEGHPIREIEKLALYYIAVNPELSSARQLRNLAAQCAQRIPAGEDRVRYDFLFPAGARANKEFWAETAGFREELQDAFVSIEGGSLVPRDLAPVPSRAHSGRRDGEPGGAVGRLAVLPLVNLSPDPDDDYFADGLTEELITELSRIPNLRVIARTSVMRYKSAGKRVRAIGSELRVGQVIEGSVRKAGNRIRITIQLVDATTEEHLWAERFDRELADIFAVQADIASSVAQALNLRFQPERAPVRPPPPRIEAYTLYLRGRFLWNQRTNASLNSAIHRFQEAIVDDPRFPLAYSGLADCYSVLIDRGVLPAKEALPLAQAAALRGLELDPQLAEAHASLGLVLRHQSDCGGAERELRAAIRVNPGYAMAHHWLHLVLLEEGRIEEAGRELAKAEESDPLSPVVLNSSAHLAWIAGDVEGALQKWDRALELGPPVDLATFNRFALLILSGRRDEAVGFLAVYESGPAELLSKLWVGACAHALMGDRGGAERRMAQLRSEPNGAPVARAWSAVVSALLGDLDEAYRIAMDRDEAIGGWWAVLRASPALANFRADPRYRALGRGTSPTPDGPQAT
ncbi:MAG TPA: AAA family ATPase [Thermoplasmata archaeon]|nr:AAA family ATPase [Thermoplasmata archaeon]